MAGFMKDEMNEGDKREMKNVWEKKKKVPGCQYCYVILSLSCVSAFQQNHCIARSIVLRFSDIVDVYFYPGSRYIQPPFLQEPPNVILTKWRVLGKTGNRLVCIRAWWVKTLQGLRMSSFTTYEWRYSSKIWQRFKFIVLTFHYSLLTESHVYGEGKS